MPVNFERTAPHRNPAHDDMQFGSRRSVVFSTKGMVASTQPLANECGLEILRKGGNAADAAVAMAAALNLTEVRAVSFGSHGYIPTSHSPHRPASAASASLRLYD
jgi:gamma-glutamyltranspeptidase/glutathione hydrolase